MSRLDPAADRPLITSDLLKARLAQRPQRQMIIEQAAQQLPPANIKMLLELRMRQAGSVRPIQEADQRRKPLPAGGKRSTASRPAGRAAVAAPAPGCIFAISLPGGRSSPPRGVKFATTGVEIGGHAGHLRGRRSTEQRRLRHPTYESSLAPPAAKPAANRPKPPARARANGATSANRSPCGPRDRHPGATCSPKTPYLQAVRCHSARAESPSRRAAPSTRPGAS